VGTEPLTVVLPATPDQVATARRLVRRTLGGRVPDDVIADLELVASELFTNAVLHGSGRDVRLLVDCTAGSASVTVESVGDARGVTEVSSWSLADPGSPYGRGLAIVRAIADDVLVRRSAEGLSVTAHRVLT
jgi:anti-sigma regulatory factor (Ser/Thr protein kinase)